MKVKALILAAMAAVVSLVSCEGIEGLGDLTGIPSIELVDLEDDVIEFDANGGERKITIKSNRNWEVDEDASWIEVDPKSGAASEDNQTVTIKVVKNELDEDDPMAGFDREANVGFTIGAKVVYLTIVQKGPQGSTESLVLYSNNFDKEEAEKTYGSGNSWPYLDQFDGWQNQTGTGAADVTYSFKGMSARSNSTSDSDYSDYEGSGSNNMFFGSTAYFAVNNIALNGATTLSLTFGTEKYSQDNGSVFTNSEYHIWLSNDGGKKWVELTDYTFAGASTEGRWNVASANFTVPSGTETLSICMKVDVASSYRMDDLKLEIGMEAGTTIDFSKAAEQDFTVSSGGSTAAPESKGKKTVAEFIAAADAQNYYELTGTVSGFNPQYCSFDITDASGKIYVYSVLDASKAQWVNKIANGGTVTVLGKYLYYEQKSQHEVVNAYIVSFTSAGGEGGNENEKAIYGNDFDKEISSKTYGSGSSWPYLDQFDGWKNAVGTGSANVTYEYKSASARATSSNNNIWLPKAGAYLSIQDIALNGASSLELSFSTICGSPGNYKKTFSSDVFKVYLSADKAKWVELPVTVTANGTEFDSAVATFSVPANTASLSITFEKIADETDGYRVDNVKLDASTAAGTAIDFANGVEKDFGAGSGSGTVTPPAGQITDVTVAQFNDKAVSTTDLYRLTGTVGGPINTTYGNFDLIDATGKVYVYGISNWSDYKSKFTEGATVTIVGQRGEYNGKIEVLEGYIESYTPAAGGEVTPPEGGEVTPPVEAGNRADFETAKNTSSYVASTTTAGWVLTNCAVQEGGEKDANPVYKLLGKVAGTNTWAKAACMNGKTTAVGTIESPELSGGCGTLSFNYANIFTEANGVNFQIEVIQNGATVKTITVDEDSVTKMTELSYSTEVNVSGSFKLKFTNLSPTNNSTSNKDRVSIWNLEWTSMTK